MTERRTEPRGSVVFEFFPVRHTAFLGACRMPSRARINKSAKLIEVATHAQRNLYCYEIAV